MRILLVVGLFFCCCQHALSQFNFSENSEIIWSQSEKKERGRSLRSILGHYNEHYYVMHYGKTKKLKGRSHGYIIKEYDSKMKETGELQFALEFPNGKRRKMEEVYLVNGVVMIFSAYASDEKENKFYLETIKLDELKKDNKITEIASVPFEKKRKSGIFQTFVAPDYSHLLVTYQYPFERGENEHFAITVFDKDFNKQWDRDLVLTYEDKLFRFIDWQIDDLGNAWILGSVSKELSRKEQRKEFNYEYHLLSYSKDEKAQKDILIDAGKDNYIFDAAIIMTSNGNIVCNSFYADYVKTSGMKGIYVMQIDPTTGEIVSSGTHDFASSFVKEFYSERELERAERKQERGKDENSELGMPDFDLHSIIADDEGGLLILSEDYELVIRTYTSYDAQGRPTTRTVYHYYYRDILAIKVNASGEISWVKLLPKYQHTTNDGGIYSSFSLAIKGDRVYIVYAETAINNVWSKHRYDKLLKGVNVSDANETVRAERKMMRNSVPRKVRKDELLQVNWIDFNGNYLFDDPLMNLTEEKIRIRPHHSNNLYSHELLLYGIWGAKQSRMGILRPN